MPSIVKSLLGVSRAPFLLLSVTLVACGAAASAYETLFSWGHTLLALVGLVAAHMGVNALNEASDMQSGIDLNTKRTPFSGGSGTIPSGALDVRTTYAWVVLVLTVAALIGIYFMIQVSPMLWPVLVVGLLAVVAYSHLLTRYGVGEFFAGLGLGALPIIGTSLVQDGYAGATTYWAAVPAFFMTFNLLLLNEFPDETADREGGRRHLVILLGRTKAAWVYMAAVAAVPVAIVLAVILGALPVIALIAVLPTLLCKPSLEWAFQDPEAEVPIPALGGNVVWNLATNLTLAATLAMVA